MPDAWEATSGSDSPSNSRMQIMTPSVFKINDDEDEDLKQSFRNLSAPAGGNDSSPSMTQYETPCIFGDDVVHSPHVTWELNETPPLNTPPKISKNKAQVTFPIIFSLSTPPPPKKNPFFLFKKPCRHPNRFSL
jgi:hypothetical protein